MEDEEEQELDLDEDDKDEDDEEADAYEDDEQHVDTHTNAPNEECKQYLHRLATLLTSDTRWLSVDAASRVCGVPKATLSSWATRELICSFKESGKNRHRLLLVSDIIYFVLTHLNPKHRRQVFAPVHRSVGNQQERGTSKHSIVAPDRQPPNPAPEELAAAAQIAPEPTGTDTMEKSTAMSDTQMQVTV